ncbi:oxidoreductase [Streptomyces sp. NPDC052236]|uniref:oxidoreductase n=1 Tax=Streptomyces sp. NPDC052236 TaxID=3365686 RepID=UPI0037D30880
MTTKELQADAANAGTAGTAGRWDLGGDLPVARMGFGAMRLPARHIDGPAGDPVRGVAVLRRAVELGVGHIDTAAFYFYGDVAANALIRTALRPYPEDLVIATKVGPQRDPDGTWLPAASPDELKAGVQQNLRELGRDRLDLVYLRVGGIAGPQDAPIGDRFAALAALREQGLIRHLALSNVTTGQLAEAQRIAPVAAVQNNFSLVTRTDSAMPATCAEQGIAFVPYFPLGGTGVPDTAPLRRIAGRHGATTAQVMLAWLLAVSPAMLAIPGTSSLTHLEENVAATALRLTPEDLAELDRIDQGPGGTPGT